MLLLDSILQKMTNEHGNADELIRRILAADCIAAYRFCLSWSKIYHKARYQLALATEDPKAAIQELTPLFSRGRKLFDVHIDYIQDSDDTVCPLIRSFTLGVCVFGIGPGCGQDFSQTPKWTVERGKRYKLRLANVGGDGTEKFSVDGHRLTVISTDFTQIEPYDTDIVTLGVGQRADVILTANNPNNADAFWVRANVAWCSLTWKGSVLAALYYEGADTNKQPATDPVPDPFVLSTTALCGNDPIEMSKPWYAMDAIEPDMTLTFNNFYTINSTGHLKFAMTFPGSYSGNYSEPSLYKAAHKGDKFTSGLEWDPDRALFNPDQVYDVGDAKVVRIVVNNPTFAQNAHAMHLHGHDFQVISNGVGFWDGKVQASNPMRRDTQIVVPDGHLVFQYEADNPGLWALHCHIPWHVADGLVVNFMVGMAYPFILEQLVDNMISLA